MLQQMEKITSVVKHLKKKKSIHFPLVSLENSKKTSFQITLKCRRRKQKCTHSKGCTFPYCINAHGKYK